MNFINSADCLSLLIKSNKIVITTHTNPDGDAIGSELGLFYFLKDLGKDVIIINDSLTPSNLEFLDANNQIKVFSYNDDISFIMNADLIVILDLNAPHRLKSMQETITRTKNTKLLIDHHIDPENFADFAFVDYDATSTGELIWEVIKPKVTTSNPKLTNPLYTAIMTDTGSFRFQKTDGDIFRTAADLLDLGADPVNCYEQVYNQNSISAIQMLGEAISSMSLFFDNKVCIMTLTKEMFETTGATIEDTDNFVEKTMSVKGVMMGILVSYLSNKSEVRVSIRSKENFIPARQIALTFGGGGHHQAAGARLFDISIEDAKIMIINEINKQISIFNY